MPRPKFLTPSSFDDLMTSGRSGESFGKAAMAVVEKLAVEMLGFVAEPEPDPKGAREWGIMNEWLALESYKERRLCEVRKPKFKVSPTLPYVGGTMDGLVGKDGGVEAKCPANPLIHFRRKEQLKTYFYQIHGYMWVYRLAWVDFISFDPRYPRNPEFELIVDRIERDEDVIATLEERCEIAHGMAQSMAQEIKERYGSNYTPPGIPF